MKRVATILWFLLALCLSAHDAVGNLAGCAYPNGVAGTYEYDALNRLKSLVADRGADRLASFNYTLNDGGQRTGMSEFIGRVNPLSRAATYTYDALRRLGRENITTGPSTGSITYDSVPGHGDAGGYDKVGNRRARAVSLTPGVPALPNTTTSHAYDARDLLGSDTYDHNGNTLRGATGAGTSPTADDGYDFEDRLSKRTVGGKVIELVYDGDGQRAIKKVTENGATTATYYLVDDRNPSGYAQVLAEYQRLLPNGESQLQRAYVYGHDLISMRHLVSGGVFQEVFYGYDGHGSVRYLMDDAGQMTDGYTYDAFGILLEQRTQSTSGELVPLGTPGAAAPTPNLYLYAGEQWDPDL